MTDHPSSDANFASRLCMVLLATLSACGLRGPLYLPEPARPVETPAAPVEQVQPQVADPQPDATQTESDDEKKSRPAVPTTP